jgi:hypothetical protein
VFRDSVKLVGEVAKELWSFVVSYEKLVAVSGDNVETQTKGKSAVGSRYQATIIESVAVDTGVCF